MNYPSYPNLIIEEPILRDFSEDSSFKYPLQSDSQVARQIANVEKKPKDSHENNSSNHESLEELILKSPIFINQNAEFSVEIQKKLFEAVNAPKYLGGLFVMGPKQSISLFVCYEKSKNVFAKSVNLKDQNNQLFKLQIQNFQSFVLTSSGILFLAQQNGIHIFEANQNNHDFILINSMNELLGELNSCSLEIVEYKQAKILVVVGGQNHLGEAIKLIHYIDVTDHKKCFFKGVTSMKTARKNPLLMKKNQNLWILGGTEKPNDESEGISFKNIAEFYQDDNIRKVCYKLNFKNKFITKKNFSNAAVVDLNGNTYIIGRNKKKILVVSKFDDHHKTIQIKYAKELKISKEKKCCNSNTFVRNEEIYCLGTGKKNIELIGKI